MPCGVFAGAELVLGVVGSKATVFIAGPPICFSIDAGVIPSSLAAAVAFAAGASAVEAADGFTTGGAACR